MPSKKSQFILRDEKETFLKIAHIAEENHRSANQEIIYMIKQKIQAYESVHGEIHIEE